MKVQKRDYSGKSVFVGIDVHKKKYVVAAVCDGTLVKKWSTPATAKALADQLRAYFSQASIKSVYEAGFSGFHLHRVLQDAGIENIVVHAASIEVESRNRVKTDKRDAQKMAELLSIGRLRGIQVPTLVQEERRSLTRGREQSVRRKQAIGNQLKMKLYYLGYEIHDDKRLCEKFIKWAQELDLPDGHKFAVDELCEAWRAERQRIKRFEAQLTKQAVDDSDVDRIYKSAPGVGSVSSRILANELGNLRQFDNEKQLYSFTGLTPSEHSSGEFIRKGHISRQGAGRLRALLIQIAWRAIGKDQSLKLIYQEIAKRRGSKRAIVAVARKFIGRIRHCFIFQEPWMDQAA